MTSNDAATCRANGWGPGTRLIGDEGMGPTVIEIRYVGDVILVARTISQNGEAVDSRERVWTLSCRDWRMVMQGSSSTRATQLDTSEDTLTRNQQIKAVNDAVLEILRASSFNAFDGQKVADELDANRKLWAAVWWDKSHAEQPILKVLDPARSNTLYLRATPNKVYALTKLVTTWAPDNIYSSMHDGHHVLGAWWG